MTVFVFFIGTSVSFKTQPKTGDVFFFFPFCIYNIHTICPTYQLLVYAENYFSSLFKLFFSCVGGPQKFFFFYFFLKSNRGHRSTNIVFQQIETSFLKILGCCYHKKIIKYKQQNLNYIISNPYIQYIYGIPLM